jgi:acyl-coenzyme A thioesterase PaaI-like protein
MTENAFQDYYEDHSSHCYGCGRLNAHGLGIKSFWDGEETICRFTPKPFHTAMPGYVYGGLIASVIDCHSTGTAAAATYRAEGRKMGTRPELRYLTASLQVDFLKPTPIDMEMTLRGLVVEIKSRKVVVEVELKSKEELCARGKVVTIRVPEHWTPE